MINDEIREILEVIAIYYPRGIFERRVKLLTKTELAKINKLYDNIF